jgi:hypothetical protein
LIYFSFLLFHFSTLVLSFILCLQCFRILHYLYSFTFLHFLISPSTLTISKRKQPRRKGEISYLIF